jgi:hypothetical protein
MNVCTVCLQSTIALAFILLLQEYILIGYICPFIHNRLVPILYMSLCIILILEMYSRYFDPVKK